MAAGGISAAVSLLLLRLLLLLCGADAAAKVQTDTGDAAVMRALSDALNASSSALGWSDAADPCTWKQVSCDSGRVTAIQIGNYSLSGTLPTADGESIRNLAYLTRLELMYNGISGALPSLSGLDKLTVVLIHDNNFSAFPPGGPDDLFTGLTSLANVSMKDNPGLPQWQIPPSLSDASRLFYFNANNANLAGTIPEFLGNAFTGLYHLGLASNNLTGGIPGTFAEAGSLQEFWLSSNALNGGIDVVSNMTALRLLWINMNNFSGPLPDFSRLTSLQEVYLRDNHLTGPVPSSLTSLTSLTKVWLANNLLQGPYPAFQVSLQYLDPGNDTGRFCLPQPGECDARVNILLSVASSLGYPIILAQTWMGNDPCASWTGITCDNSGNVTIVNLSNMQLSGTISPDFQLLPSLQKLLLSNNNLTGVIPPELAAMGSLQQLDVSNNALWGKVPNFNARVAVNVQDNPNIGKDAPGSGNNGGGHHSSSVGIVVGVVVAAIFLVLLAGVLVFLRRRRKLNGGGRAGRPQDAISQTPYCGSDAELLKVSVPTYGFDSWDKTSCSDANDVPAFEGGNLKISIEVLRRVTNNFSEDNILGRGGFGTVYKGELGNGTKVAVKRMAGGLGVAESKGLTEFQAEISVLTRVRHKHLVSLLGYCLEENEKILVYEHMPQGTLSDHLFIPANAAGGKRPLDWKSRLRIALDVARGVEYLHNLAHGTFIHRDLKPSNILLGDDMRAKVADFGLVRLAPDGTFSVETRLAGTFGYLAPEYATTGRVTTRADIYSFGVILMELICGRRALDNNQPEESVHLVTWFRRMQINGTFSKIIDPSIDLTEETSASIDKVAELAAQCCARSAHERPAMNHVVNVLSSLAEFWQPSNANLDDGYDIDVSMTLPEALGRWQSSEDSTQGDGITPSAYLPNLDISNSSIPPTDRGFAEALTTRNGR